jgi:hypothetical protein
MYKTRLKTWGTSKNNSEQEAWAMMRKRVARQAIGKETVFRKRGKPVVKDLERYFNRKGFKNPEAMARYHDAPTPPDLSCLTPPRVATPTTAPMSRIIELPDDDNGDAFEDWQQAGPSNGVLNRFNPEQSRPGQPSQAHSSGYSEWNDQYIFADVNPVRDLISYGLETQQLRRTPAPPTVYLVNDLLFHNVRSYLRGSYGNGVFAQFQQSRLDMIKSTRGDGDLGRFSNLWTTGNQLFSKGRYVEGRRVFGKVFEALDTIVKEADPGSLSYLLEMHLDLGRKLPEMAVLLRAHMEEAAKVYHPKDHPWRTLMAAISKLDQGSLNQAILNSWHLTNEELKMCMGQFDPGYLNSYTQWAACVQDPVEMEENLRGLVKTSGTILRPTDDRYLRIRCEHAWSLFHRGNFVAALEAAEKLIIDAWTADAKGFEIDALRLAATCHYELGRVHGAENLLKETIIKLQAFYGRLHPRALRFMMTLQGWLRGWGREDDAAKYNDAIDAILGPDEV